MTCRDDDYQSISESLTGMVGDHGYQEVIDVLAPLAESNSAANLLLAATQMAQKHMRLLDEQRIPLNVLEESVRNKSLLWSLQPKKTGMKAQILKFIQSFVSAPQPFEGEQTEDDQRISKQPLASHDNQGFEFVTEDGGTPYYVDVLDDRLQSNVLFLAGTRSGRSALFGQIVPLAMSSEIPVVIVDYSGESSRNPFGTIAGLKEEVGNHFKMARNDLNFLEPPDLSAFDPDIKDQSFNEFKGHVVYSLMTILCKGEIAQSKLEIRFCKSLLGHLINLFYQDSDINQRFQTAIDASIGSEAWQDTPTLKDFVKKACSETMLNSLLEKVEPKRIQLLSQVMDKLKRRLQAFMQTDVGRSLSSPTTLSSQSKLLTYGVEGSANDEEASASILLSAAVTAAMRQVLSVKRSILFIDIDQASILSRSEILTNQIANIASYSVYAGIRLMMSLPTPIPLMESSSCDTFRWNLNVQIIGRVDTADVGSYATISGVPEEIICTNTSGSFRTEDASDLHRLWLVADRRESEIKYDFVRHCAPCS